METTEVAIDYMQQLSSAERMPTILVTPRSVTANGHPALERLVAAGYDLRIPTPGNQPDESALLANVPGCSGYLAGVEPISGRLLHAAPELKVISRNGTGVNNIDLETAGRCGIRVMRADGANARGVAELTIGLVLALVRSIPYSDAGLKQVQWSRRVGIEVEGLRLGLVGCGKVGRLVASMAHGLGMEVSAYDPYPSGANDDFSYTSLDQILSKSDVISLHCPPLPGESPLLNRENLSRMKRGVFIVNTSRGELLHDDAVVSALNDGQIAGLAMDVFRQEPPGDSPLIAHERVIATPHIGAYTEQSIDRAVQLAVDNLLTALAGAL